MRAALKTAVVVVPFLVVFLSIRACAGGAAGRWQARVASYEEGVKIVVDSQKLIVIAGDVERGSMIGHHVQRFRDALIENFGGLLGRGREQRTVVVLFSSLDALRGCADGPDPRNTGRAQNLHGFTRPDKNAVFLPPDSTIDTLRHEVVHLLMEETHGGAANYSPWLGEGLAQLFEQYDPEAAPPTPPGIDQNARALIALTIGADTIDVQRLLQLQDYDAFVHVDGMRNYLEALVLAAFLFEQRDRGLLRQYVKLERAYTEGREEAFDRLYQYKRPLFSAELKEFLRRIRQSGGR